MEIIDFKIGNRESLVEFWLDTVTIELLYQGPALLACIDFKIYVLVLLPIWNFYGHYITMNIEVTWQIKEIFVNVVEVSDCDIIN